MTLFHGTNKNITDGIASGTYFSNDFDIALHYMREKKGNKIYAITFEEYFITDVFSKDIFDEHFICRCFIPIDKVIKMEVQI